MPASSSARRPTVQYMNRLKRMPRLLRELVQFGHVVVQDALLEPGRQMRRLLGDHVLAPRPGRIAVREVRRPHQLMRIEMGGELEGRPVVLESERDVPAE